MRTHQPEYMLMLYYPQDTPEDLGPTEILPCTQYFHNVRERKLCSKLCTALCSLPAGAQIG